MRRQMRGWLLIAAVSVSPPASLEQSTAVPDWANRFLRSWYAAYNRGDAAAVAGFFSPDARLAHSKGRANIQKALAADFARTQFQCAGSFAGFRVLGDLAVGWGGESCRETHRLDGRATDTREQWLLVFERVDPGQWLLVLETYEPLE